VNCILFVRQDDNGSDDDGSSVVGAAFHPPATSFCRLNVATNLNPPPSNWLMSGEGGHVPRGVDQVFLNFVGQFSYNILQIVQKFV
jgi:hypothetical protein